MGLFEQLPYTNYHDLNLTELVKMVKELAREMHDFEVVNKISYGGDWDITKQYAPWSVVAVNGIEGYISIRPVPAGIDYTNNEYWRLVADFTVQLADLGNRVSDLESEDVIINGKITTINNNINTINNDLLHSKLWKDRRVLWVGDSYGNGWDGSQIITNPYSTASGFLGCSYENISHGGCRFGTAGTDPQYKYRTYIQDYIDNHTDMDTFTDVIILGGANDITFNPNDDISGEFTTTINLVKLNFPYAKIRVGMVARMAQTGATNATLGNVIATAKKYRDCSTANGVEYIEKSEVINHDYTLLASDGIHLTSYQEMGEKLACLLLSGDFTRKSSIPMSYVLTDTDADNLKPSTISVQSTMHVNDTVLIDFTDLQFDFNPSKTLTWGKAYRVAKISGGSTTRNGFCAGYKAYRQTIPCSVVYVEGGNTLRTTLPITFYLYDNYLMLSFNGMLPSGSINLSASTIFVRTGIQFILDEYMC